MKQKKKEKEESEKKAVNFRFGASQIDSKLLFCSNMNDV